MSNSFKTLAMALTLQGDTILDDEMYSPPKKKPSEKVQAEIKEKAVRKRVLKRLKRIPEVSYKEIKELPLRELESLLKQLSTITCKD